MSAKTSIDNSVIFCSLSINSTTLYTYENSAITGVLGANCSELVARELGAIDSTSEERHGSINVNSNILYNGNQYVKLNLYYYKKLCANNDLITLIGVSTDKLSKDFVINLLNELIERFKEFKEANDDDIAEFKVIMKEIISREESKHNNHLLNYGSIQETNDEINEVYNLMNENIERVLERDERINLLVNKTDRINNSANSFRRRTIAVRRKLWWSNVKYVVLISLFGIVLLYLLLGIECGLPFYNKCFHKPE